MLVAGIVGMLSFLTNALSITTQRFLSFEQGADNKLRQELIFTNSLFIHISLGVLVFLILEVVGLFLFDGFLTINLDRISAAKTIYHIALTMVFVSILTSPFRACLISHENLVFISIIDVADGIWKVVIAIMISVADADRLILYSALSLGIYIFTLISFVMYSLYKYKECKALQRSHLNKSIIRELAVFAGWSLYSSGCIIARNQGTAIVLNRFFGTIINASYGIAVQISGALNFISSSLLTAFNPPIAKSAGKGDYAKMIRLSQSASKFSLILICMFGIPLLSRLSDILEIWLGEVPDNATLLCSVIMVTGIIDQISSGLISANRALGKLKLYSLTVDTIKLLCVPLLAIGLFYGVELIFMIWVYAFCEFLSAVIRIPVLKRLIDLNINEWIRDVLLKTLVPIAFLILTYLTINRSPFSLLLFILECVGISFVYLVLCYFIALKPSERTKVKSMANRLIRRKND